MPLSVSVPEQGEVFRDLEAIASMPRYYDWKAALVEKYLGRRILEVGCGTGLLMERLAGRELLLGVDRNAECIRRARLRLEGRAGVELVEMDALSPGFSSLARFNPDTVVFVNTLETIPDDRQAVQHAGVVLKPGGTLVVLASAMPGLAGELDRSHGQRRYTRPELCSLLESGGFRVETARFVNLLGMFGWWLDSRVRETKAMSPAAYRSRDRLVPLARLLDAVTGPPRGSILLAVGVRE